MTNNRKKLIQDEAAKLLRNHGVTEAPVEVEEIAEKLGIAVRKTPANDEISGFLFKQPQGGTVIGVNTLHHPNRQRFTIAHEIGHFMLHDHDQVHVDRFVVKLRSEKSSTGEDEQEVEANRFAAELLMPAAFVERDLRELGIQDLHDDRAMLQLARKYKVSVQAMATRLNVLEYFVQSST
jgi:Zn-dependent peptidase ImmA (M78 family)